MGFLSYGEYMTDISEPNDTAETKEAFNNEGWRNTTIDDAQEQANPQNAQAVERIKRLRQSIDNVDTAIVSLLAERFKCTAEVGVLKAQAGFAPEDREREKQQAQRLKEVAINAGLDPSIEENYREFVVTEAKKRHQRIAEAGGNPGVLNIDA